MRVLGVDPGKSGALAVCDGDQLVTVIDMPEVGGVVSPSLVALALADLLPIDRAAVEKVNAMPRQGVTSTFTFGTSYGVVLGVLAALQIPVRFVRPTEWKKAYRLSSDKELSRRRALDLFPEQAGLFARRKDEGRAEAALIALWEVSQ